MKESVFDIFSLSPQGPNLTILSSSLETPSHCIWFCFCDGKKKFADKVQLDYLQAARDEDLLCHVVIYNHHPFTLFFQLN